MEGRDKVLMWRKWHKVDDGGLWVASETTTSKGAETEITYSVMPPPDLADEMIYRAEGAETVDRHYHPRVGQAADLQKSTRKIAFKVHIINGLFKRISLRRHADRGERPAEMWCGRASEKEAFGFNTRGSKNLFFVTLAYPGKTPEFEPVFIKVREAGDRVLPYYLKVDAHDEADGVVVVEVREVDQKQVPAFLREQY